MKINKEQICSVEKKVNVVNENYTFEKAERSLFSSREEGFYYLWNYRSPVTIEEIEENNCFIKNQTVYFKPYLKFWMSNRYNQIVFFDTEEELNEFLDKHITGSNWIEIN
jgi:hypothetical protein